MSLTELQADVIADASLHLPDVIYDTQSSEHSMKFGVIPMSALLIGEDDLVGLDIARDRHQNPTEVQYMFSRWSRQQILSLLGTKERWFSFVDLEWQAHELNMRLHALQGYNFRTSMAVDDDFPVRFVRGVVSSFYADIPNTEIMAAVVDKMPPEAVALRAYSGLTDRSFYAYVLSPSPITIPGTNFFEYPGAVIRNSDVGYTSLYVIPMLVTKAQGAPVVLEAKAVLKRIHRGRINLAEKFEEAFAKCAAMWADMAAKIPHLASKQYSTQDTAVEAMRRLLGGALASQEFMLKCERVYLSCPRNNTALDIFEAVNEVCATIGDRDENFAAGAIAGAVLFKLLF